MKKTGIIMAMFAVLLVSASYSRGEVGAIGFDGGRSQTGTFDGFKRVLPEFEATIPVPVAPSDMAQSEVIVYKLGKIGRRALIDAVLKTDGTALDRNVFMLINDEKADILYNSKNVFFVNSVGANKYATILKSDDSGLIGLLQKLNNQAMPQTKQAVVVCELVKEVVMQLMWDAILKIWTQVAVETGKLIEACHTDTVPDPPSPGSGSTYHNGQGGNSNYDVNKHLK